MPPTQQAPLTITIDYAQPRISNNRLMTLVHGGFERNAVTDRDADGWSEQYQSYNESNEPTTFIDPVTKTLMLTPAPLLPSWQSQNTGIYTRFKKADYTLTTPDNWVDDCKDNGASNFLVGLDSTLNEPVKTTASMPQNCPIFLSWFGSNWGNAKFLQMLCGWSATPNAADGVALAFFSNGECEVFKNGQLFKKHKFSGGDDKKDVEQTSGNIVAALMIPMRNRELLVLTNRGGGFAHVFDDIAEDEQNPIITDAAPFWWFVPSGKAEVECSAFGFPTNGYRCGILTSFDEPPDAGAQEYDAVGFTVPGFGAQSVSAHLVSDTDATLSFVPDGSKTNCRLRADLTGDGASTPFVAYGLAYYLEQISFTDDSEEADITGACIKCSMEVPEALTGTKLTTELAGPETIDGETNSRIATVVNRPLKATFGANIILDGLMNAPKLKDSVFDETRIITVETRDKTKLLENFRFRNRTPFDGYELEDAFAEIAYEVGFGQDEQFYSHFGFKLPATAAPSRGDFAVFAEVGDQGSQWFERLHTDYCATAFMGIALLGGSNPAICVVDRDDMPTDPVLDVYDTVAAALADGVDRSDLKWRVIREFHEDHLEPETNDIHVVGVDRRYYRPIVYHYPDLDSQDATLPPSLRPDNWLGEIRRYSWIDPSLSTTEACERCATLLFDRLTPLRYLGEFTTGLLRDPQTGVPVWRGDVIRYHRAAKDEPELYRISTLSLSFDKEPTPDDPFEWREVKYVAEKIVGAANGLTGHRTNKTNLKAIKAAQELRLAMQSHKNQMPGLEGALKRPPIRVVHLA